MPEKKSLNRKAGIECLENALNLSESSEILHNTGKVGVATSLMVLASEELAKAEIYGLLADDLISLDKNDLGKKYVIAGKILKDHTTKGIHFMGYNAVSHFVELFEKKG